MYRNDTNVALNKPSNVSVQKDITRNRTPAHTSTLMTWLYDKLPVCSQKEHMTRVHKLQTNRQRRLEATRVRSSVKCEIRHVLLLHIIEVLILFRSWKLRTWQQYLGIIHPSKHNQGNRFVQNYDRKHLLLDTHESLIWTPSRLIYFYLVSMKRKYKDEISHLYANEKGFSFVTSTDKHSSKKSLLYW